MALSKAERIKRNRTRSLQLSNYADRLERMEQERARRELSYIKHTIGGAILKIANEEPDWGGLIFDALDQFVTNEKHRKVIGLGPTPLRL